MADSISIGKLHADIEARDTTFSTVLQRAGQESAQLNAKLNATSAEMSRMTAEGARAARALETTGQAATQMSAKVTEAGTSTQRLTASISNATSQAVAFGGTLVALEVGNKVLGSISATVEKGIDFNSVTQQARIGFETMTGSVDVAQKHLADLTKFAASTPFELKGLIPESQKLQAFGFDVERVIPMLTSIGNAMAGLGRGQEGIDRVVTAFGQIQAKGRLMSEEMLQLTEAGLPAWDALAKKIGVDIPTAMDMVEKRQVSSATAIDALLQMMDQRFGGLMERQSHTFAGIQSNLKDLEDQLSGTLTAPVFQRMTAGLGELQTELAKPDVKQGAEAIGEAFGQAADDSGAALHAIVDDLNAVAESARGTAREINNILGGAGVSGGLGELYTQWQNMNPFLAATRLGANAIGGANQFLRDRERERNTPPPDGFGAGMDDILDASVRRAQQLEPNDILDALVRNDQAVSLAADASVERQQATAQDYYAHLGEAWLQAAEGADFKASVGAGGAAIEKALAEVAAHPNSALPAGTKALEDLAAAVEKVKAEIRQVLPPEEAARWIDELVRRVELARKAAVEEIGPEARASLGSFLQSVHTDVPERGREIRTAEAEAKRLAAAAEAEAKRQAEHAATVARQEAERQQREAERAAEQHAQMIANFNRTMVQGSMSADLGLGRAPNEVLTALDRSFEKGASGSQGDAAAKAVLGLRDAAKTAGVPAWRELGEELGELMGHALVARTEDAKGAVIAKVKEIAEAVAAQSRLTVDNLNRTLGDAQQKTVLGTEGSSLMTGLKKSAEDGTPEALKAVGDSMEAIRRKLMGDEGLTPEQARAWYQEVMNAVVAVIQDGSEEAQQTLIATLGRLNLEAPIAALEHALDERLAEARRRMEQQKAEIETQFEQSRQDASDAATDSRTLRGTRQNVTDTQETAYKNVADQIDQARQNLRYFREDQQLEIQQHRAIVDLQTRQAEQLDDLRRKHLSVATASTGGFRAAGAQSQQTTQHADPGYEAFRAMKDASEAGQKEMANLLKRQEQEQTDRDQRRAWAAEDLATEKGNVTTLTQFKKDQAKDAQTFEDQQADEAWQRQWGAGGKSEQARDKRVADLETAYADMDKIENEKLDERKDRLRELVSPVSGMMDRPFELVAQMDPIIRSWGGAAGIVAQTGAGSLGGKPVSLGAEALGQGITGAGLGPNLLSELRWTRPEPTAVPEPVAAGMEHERALNRQLLGGPAFGPPGATHQTIVQGNVFGLHEGATVLGDYRRQMEDDSFASNGLG